MTPQAFRSTSHRGRSAALVLITSILLLGVLQTADARDRLSPNDWLDRMSGVVSTIDYEGTVMRRKNGRAEALKVMHRVVDGVVNEKVVTQEGDGLEIIRKGNEVHCILPEKKSVLIEQWNDRSTLFSTLPSSELRFGSEYDLSIVREERVAGRAAVLLAIRPHDAYRFGHRLWLDLDTAFPLRTELVDGDGTVLEQLKFADIKFNSEISDAALRPSLDLANFTWYSEPARTDSADVDSAWHCEDLPGGFQLVSTRIEEMPGIAAPVTHIVYSDGLATVSVFVTSQQDRDIAEHHRVGAANSYSTLVDEHQVTAVGEVPAVTVQRIARAMRQR